MKRFIYIAALLLCGVASAQLIEEDIVMNSQHIYSGTARFNGLGGAMGALGGDLTAATINPAGAGVFRAGQFAFTPTLKFNHLSSDFTMNLYDETQKGLDDFNVDFDINQLGFVFGNTNPKSDGWVSINFVFQYNKLADYSSDFSAGVNNVNYTFMETVVDDWAQNNEFVTDFHYMANNTGQILEDDQGYFTDFAYFDVIAQTIDYKVTTDYKMNEYNFLIGGNYQDKFYLGGGIGVVSSRLTQDIVYKEGDYSNVVNFTEGDGFHSVEYTEENTITSRGANVKLGAIVRPHELLRVGTSVHTPTLASIDRRMESSMASIYDNSEVLTDRIVPLEENTTLITPWRVTGSVALVSKFGLISADYEFVDYASQSVESTDYDKEFELSKTLKGTHNFRVGTEIKAGPALIRAGYSLYADPYKGGTSLISGAYDAISGGVGVHRKNYYFDVAYQLIDATDIAHNFLGVQRVESALEQRVFLATLGFKF